MTFLLRVELPDVPGSLGRLASAIGTAGADIEALEIIDKRADGTAVDDILVRMPPGMLPDGVVSSVHGLDGVRVLWINRYPAGGQLFLDLEVVEQLTAHKAEAVDRLVGMLPGAFRVDWAAKLQRYDGVGHVVLATETAPAEIGWHELDEPSRLPGEDEITLCCGVPVSDDVLIVVGRDGGPPFLDSELARIGHLVALASSMSPS